MGFSSSIDQLQSNMPSNAGKGQAPAPRPTQQANIQPIQTNWGGTPQPSNGSNPQMPQPMGKGGVQSNSATSGQPRMGQQNQYSNTVGQWDNTQQQPQSHFGGGKGKG